MRHSWYRDDKRSEAAVDARSKRMRDPEPSPSETQDRRPAAGRATVLGLQRTAGNRAVSRLLGDPAAGTASAAFRPLLASRLTAPTVRTIQRKPNLQPVQHAKVKDHAMGRMVGKLTALKKTADPAKWIRSVLEHWCGEYSKQGAPPLTFNDDDVGVLLQWLVNEYLPWWDHGEFDEVMANLQRKGGKQEYIDRLLAITDWPSGTKPRIVASRSVTTGANYDRSSHLIKISPDITDATAALDFITFECENARRRHGFQAAQKQGGRAVAELEFQSDKAYAEALKSVYRAADWNQLVTTLGVPPSLCLQQPYNAGDPPSKNLVQIPPKSVLGDQAKRQALWYFKTQSWTEEQRKEVWIASAHGEGLGSSEQLYSAQLKAAKK